MKNQNRNRKTQAFTLKPLSVHQRDRSAFLRRVEAEGDSPKPQAIRKVLGRGLAEQPTVTLPSAFSQAPVQQPVAYLASLWDAPPYPAAAPAPVVGPARIAATAQAAALAYYQETRLERATLRVVDRRDVWRAKMGYRHGGHRVIVALSGSGCHVQDIG